MSTYYYSDTDTQNNGMSFAQIGAALGGSLGTLAGLAIKLGSPISSMIKIKDIIPITTIVGTAAGYNAPPYLQNIGIMPYSENAWKDRAIGTATGAGVGVLAAPFFTVFIIPAMLGTVGAGIGYAAGSTIDIALGNQSNNSAYHEKYGWKATVAQLKAGAIGEAAGLKFDTIKQHGAQLLASIGKSRTDGMNNLPFADAKEIGSNLIPAITQQASARRF